MTDAVARMQSKLSSNSISRRDDPLSVKRSDDTSAAHSQDQVSAKGVVSSDSTKHTSIPQLKSATSAGNIEEGLEAHQSTSKDCTARKEQARSVHRSQPHDDRKRPLSNEELDGDLRFCAYVLSEIRGPEYGQYNHVFQAPMDPVALNIPHYPIVVKFPVHLSTIESKLCRCEYATADDFTSDFDLMIENCLCFNPTDIPVRDLELNLQQSLKDLWKYAAS